MQSVNKIHSTRISLNDRFTIIQTVQPNAAAAAPRRRRSQSASSRVRTSPKSSLQNRRLLEQLDQKHYMMRTALRLKKKSLRSNLPLRQRMNTQMKNRILKRGRTATTLSVGPGGRLKRANSLRNVGTMRADLVGNGNLRRSNSALNLAGRLGVRAQAGGPNNRRRLIRNNVATQRSRSRSRTRPNLVRSNSQTNLRRSNSKQSLAAVTPKRNNSQVRGRSASRQRPRLQRSNSRKNLNAGPRNRGNVAGPNRRIGINGRLGVKQTQPRNIQRGRITKRRNSTVNGKNGNVGTVGRNGARQRVARSRTRVAQSNPRNRSASRGRNGRQANNFAPNNQQNNRSRQNGRGRGGGRSRSRGRPGRPNAGAANKQPIKTKEELDKELDQYMVNTKSNEIDIFMG